VDVFYHRGDLNLDIRHIQDDMVLPHPNAGHARQICQGVAVLIPYLRDAVQMLVGLPKITIVDREIRPSVPYGFGAY
jgi:hypothetical protein